MMETIILPCRHWSVVVSKDDIWQRGTKNLVIHSDTLLAEMPKIDLTY